MADEDKSGHDNSHEYKGHGVRGPKITTGWDDKRPTKYQVKDKTMGSGNHSQPKARTKKESGWGRWKAEKGKHGATGESGFGMSHGEGEDGRHDDR